MKKIIFAVIIGLASILTVCDTKASVCPDGCDGPYWMQVPHPFQLTGCDVLFEYCTGIDSITGELMVYIGEIIILDRGSCAIEALLSIQFTAYVPYFVSKLLEAAPELNVPPCSSGNEEQMIIVIMNECMTEVHQDPAYAPPGVGGYVYRSCATPTKCCKVHVKACLNEYGGIIIKDFPSVSTHPCGITYDSYNNPIQCYSTCPWNN